MRTNTVKKALREGKVQYGCAFSSIPSPEVARILATAGFHWTYLDAEHGCCRLVCEPAPADR